MLTLLGSVPVGALGLGLFRLQVENSPADARSCYFSANAAVNGTVCLAGSFVCSALIEAIDRRLLPLQISDLFLAGAALTAVTLLSVRRLPQNGNAG